MTKENNRCCLDIDTGVERCVLYIGATGCTLAAFLMFVMYFLYQNPHAVVSGIVALVLAVFILVTSR